MATATTKREGAMPNRKIDLETWGDKAFSVAGPKLWDDCPRELKQEALIEGFQKSLKTHLSKKSIIF